MRKSRLQELAEDGRASARAALALRNEPERFLATVQIGITVVGAAAAAFGGSTLATRLEPLIAALPLVGQQADAISLGIVIAGVSYFSIVLGELVPKSLALRSAEAYALLVSKALWGLSWLARPLVWFLTASSNVVLRPFGDRTNFSETRHSSEEIQHYMAEATRSGTIHPQAGEIASRALDFAELRAVDVMVPRQDVVMLKRNSAPDDTRRILLEQTHNRMPVYEERVDNIVGYVCVKDLLLFAFEQRLIVLDDVMRPPHFVPETMPAIDLLQDMRTRRLPFSIVVDEQGQMSGIVTLEDLLEELVGEIFSEHAQAQPEPIRPQPDGTALVSGNVPTREVNRALGIELPDEDGWNTLAGLYLHLAGRIPQVGDQIATPCGSKLEVTEATPRRIRMLRVHPPPTPTLEEAQD